ncbi:hypothetical protein [Yoonia sp. SDW83-1]|uniref:hypothetical protein n=1 Tax=Yoonia sp. SDW83-1 TaxID=3366945 RepID=UPI00398C360B
MKNLMSTAALSFTLIGASTFALADAHADVTAVTCAEFAEMELIDQESMLAELTATVEGADNDEVMIGDVQVLCNGSEDETVASVLSEES